MRGETGVAPFLSARLGGLSDGGGVVDGCGQEVCRGRGGGGIRMSLLFSCLTYRMRPGEAASSRLVYSVSVCVSSGRLAFCLVSVSLWLLVVGAAPVPFVFCLCVLLVAMIDGSCRPFCLVSRFAPRLVLSVPFFFLSSSERVARRGARRSARVGVLFFFLWRGRSIPALRLARRGEGARREMMRVRRFIQLDFSETNK